MRSIYNRVNPAESSPISSGIEGAVGASVSLLRARELRLFREDRDSPAAIRLGSVRTELQRVLSGRPVRLEALEHAVQPPADSVDGAESDLATEPEAVEVAARG
jgi:hypothetical protein